MLEFLWPGGSKAARQTPETPSPAAGQNVPSAGVQNDQASGTAQVALAPEVQAEGTGTASEGAQAVAPLGRPAARSDVGDRQRVLQFLNDQGPGVGVPSVRRQFPDLTRAELTDLVQRYRRVLAARRRATVSVLHWQVPGRVWAMDFAQPSRGDDPGAVPPLDGRSPYLFAVRDLASGYQLCWLPVAAATAAVARTVLAWLFAQYGAPLVLKADNGPPFRADAMKNFLEAVGVIPLYSPPYWPGYNGAIEAAIGSLKTRTEQQAAYQGHPGIWMAADVEAGRRAANTSRPRRLHGLMPAEVWARRTPTLAVERVCFELAVQRQRYLARGALRIEHDKQLDHWQQGVVDRKAIERALVERDYLLFTRRRLPLMIGPGKVTYFV
jgi:transposase InsO family protein